MLIHPMWDPIAIKFHGLSIRWYGIAYFISIILFMHFGKNAIKNKSLLLTQKEFDSFITAAIIGIIVGGRLAYMVFYQTQAILNNPLSLFKIWQGGMSFHGGFLGVLCAVIYHYIRYGNFWHLSDFVCKFAPIGLFFGRLANFINGELYGRISNSDYPWLIIYPWVDNNVRHPSQLYEMLGEGLILFAAMQMFSLYKPKPGLISGLFCVMYGVIRFILEFFREPDVQIGFIWHNWLTMGQILSIPVLFLGIIIIIRRNHD